MEPSRGTSPRNLGRRFAHEASDEQKLKRHTREFRDRNVRRVTSSRARQAGRGLLRAR
jgi:hypothetical protein